MKPEVIKAKSLKAIPTTERCSITENYSAVNLSIAEARVKPGITTSAHHLVGIDEIYIIIDGEGQVDVGDLKPTKVVEGDLIIIPADVSQRISNIGKTDLVFYCICTPRFTPEGYRDEENKGEK